MNTATSVPPTSTVLPVPGRMSSARATLLVLQGSAALLAEQGFSRAGGTALGIYYAHRRSADLDWFTTQPINDPLRLAQSLKDTGIALIIDQTAPGTLHGHIGAGRGSF